MHSLKNETFKGCETTEILIVRSTQPVACVFKLKSINDTLGSPINVMHQAIIMTAKRFNYFGRYDYNKR